MVGIAAVGHHRLGVRALVVERPQLLGGDGVAVGRAGDPLDGQRCHPGSAALQQNNQAYW